MQILKNQKYNPRQSIKEFVMKESMEDNIKDYRKILAIYIDYSRLGNILAGQWNT